MYINFQQNRVCRSVKTVRTNIFAQLVNSIWSIYTRSNKTRVALIIIEIIINGATIKVYDDKPIHDI